MIKKSITLNASKEAIWEAIISYRTANQPNRKILSSENGRAVIEESFHGIPIVGSSRIIYEELESPFESIKFRLMESDKLSRFDGGWSLEDVGSGNVLVVLTANLESHLPIPFKESFLTSEAEKDIQARLEYVKAKVSSL